MRERDEDARAEIQQQRRSCAVILGFGLAVAGAWLVWGWEAALLVAGVLIYRGTS